MKISTLVGNTPSVLAPAVVGGVSVAQDPQEKYCADELKFLTRTCCEVPRFVTCTAVVPTMIDGPVGAKANCAKAIRGMKANRIHNRFMMFLMPSSTMRGGDAGVVDIGGSD